MWKSSPHHRVGRCHEIEIFPTNAIVDQLNTTITDRLLDTGRLDRDQRIDIDGQLFSPGHAVVLRRHRRAVDGG